MGSFARLARAVVVSLLLLGGLVGMVVVAPTPAGAAAPVVDKFVPITINLAMKAGTQDLNTNKIQAIAYIRHDPGVTVDKIRFGLTGSTSNCGATVRVWCSGGYVTNGGWNVATRATAANFTVRELPGQAASTTKTDSNYSQVLVSITPPNYVSWQNDETSTGCGIESSTPRVCKNQANFSFGLSDGTTTSDSSFSYWSVPNNDSGNQDWPVVESTNGSTHQAVAGASVTVGFACDDQDGSGGSDDDCNNARVRFRRVNDNTMTVLTCANATRLDSESDSLCETPGGFNADDNQLRKFSYPTPSGTGFYVIELEGCNEGGSCPNSATASSVDSSVGTWGSGASLYGGSGNDWQYLGSFYVNATDAAITAIGAKDGATTIGTRADGTLHPDTGATMSLTATTGSDTQIVDWNLDQASTGGINNSAYEERTYGTVNYASGIGAPTVVKTASLDLSGYGSSVNCAVGARVYDMGGINATDVSVTTDTISKTCTTNGRPTSAAQSAIQTARGATTNITLATTDADKWTSATFAGAGGDEVPTVAVTQPAEGTVSCGTFVATTATAGGFPCTYTVPAGAAPGPFSFTYAVTDSHAGTSTSSTVSGSIKPTITGAAAPAANGDGWNNTNVTVTYTCTSSSLASCTAPQVITSEGSALSSTGTATDTIGNSASTTVSGIKIDKTAPTLSGAATSGPNGAGWYRADVPVTWSCADALSGVVACPTTAITGEGATRSATASVSDRAGNSTSATTPTVQIDRTNPSTDISATPTWSTSAVTATLTPSDNLSGVAATSFEVDGGPTQSGTSVSVSGDGDHTVTYRSIDAAGNTEPTRTAHVRIDGTAPTISASQSPAANGAGWNKTPVTVTFTCADGTSGVASCTSPATVSGDGAAQVVPGTATDNAGNSAATSASVNLDATAPTITPSLPAANAAGWYRAPVTASFSCGDATSGIASCTAPTEVATEGAGQSVTGTAVDTAGNSATAVAAPIDIDLTDPTITAVVEGTPNASGWYASPVTVSFECSDALSGIASGACPEPVELTEAGTRTAEGTVLDRAGNSGYDAIEVQVAGPLPTITADRSPAANAFGWNAEAVTVTFTCTTDALVSCTQPQTVSTDGAGQSVTGTVTDAYGQSASTTLSAISIDRADPLISGVATTPPNAAGWYSAPPVVHWTCSDALSGIEAGACPDDTTTSGEGLAVTASGSTADRAGNAGSAISESLQVDLSPPSTSVSSAPTWSRDDVTITLTGTDGLSGVASTHHTVDGGPEATGDEALVSGEGEHVVEYWSVDVAGNAEAPQQVTVRIDLTAPSIVPHRTPAANANGWNNEPVTVTFGCGDTPSGIASCTGDQTFEDEVDTTVTGEAVDNAGNTATAQATVRIDLTAPTVVAQVPTPNEHGWFNGPVQVPFTCSDTGGSGIGDQCPTPATYGGEGEDQAVTAIGYDNAGNAGTADGGTIDIDLTAPVISGAATRAANPDGGYFGDVTVHWTCSDALSGLLPAACPADEVVSGEGVHTVSGSVDDKAGNTSTSQVTIRIDHNPADDPGIIHGTATDGDTGQPVANAVVRLAASTNAGQILYQTVTGTDGTYLFPAVADGTYRLTFTKNGVYLPTWYPAKPAFSQSTVLTVAHGTNQTISQALPAGYKLNGVVTAPGGAPLSGVNVRTVSTTAVYDALTDSSGRYSVTGMVANSYQVQMIGLGSVTYASSNIAIPGVGTMDRTLSAAAVNPAGVKGTIRSAVTGQPLAGSTVRVWLKDHPNFVLTASTGSTGRWSILNLPAGSYQFDVVRPSYKVRWWNDSGSRSTAQVLTYTTACASAPDPTWGDPCATRIDIAQPS
jgi:hypothetical protein